ncbi:MAG: hypothetical protein HOU81_21510 [Hamadaea sp.]|uniref:hypothetical protein n=1 Tax=Hamadaea sp. TaxID=2024425 RepID=UPI00184FCB91|nr:hypothetical protein [Hamadaea sp.]NUR73405.1 hypothetical protein [Hamadaea sp.]NUT18552.1 hypothetical protein [Hamadaea sp.]
MAAKPPARWHSAGWWAAVGGILAALSLVVTLVQLFKSEPSGPVTRAGTSATATATAAATPSPSRSPAETPFTVAVRDRTTPCGVGWVLPAGQGVKPGDGMDEDDQWRTWAAAQHAIPTTSGVDFTVQGRSTAQVVLLGMHIRVIERLAPAKGTAYGLACGGDGVYRWISANLDPPTPKLSSRYDESLDPEGDLPQRRGPVKFPYTVAIGDAEVFTVFGTATKCLCRWVIDLDWSSQGETGTFTIDDHGQPFQTTGVTQVDLICTKNQYQPLNETTDCRPQRR